MNACTLPQAPEDLRLVPHTREKEDALTAALAMPRPRSRPRPTIVHDPSPNQAAPNLNPAALESVANPPTIGEKLRELREQIGLSQMEVAILCGVDVSTISRWERGRHQHTHRSKDRQIRAALEALQWAAELQEEDAARVLTLEEVQEYVNRRRRARGGSR